MEDQEIEGLIRSSFLKDEQKEELLKIFKTTREEGLEQFMILFDQYIANDIKERDAKYQQAMALLEDVTKKADAEYERAQGELDKEMEEALKKMETTDTVGRDRLWAEYDKKVETIQKAHHEGLKAAAAVAYML